MEMKRLQFQFGPPNLTAEDGTPASRVMQVAGLTQKTLEVWTSDADAALGAAPLVLEGSITGPTNKNVQWQTIGIIAASGLYPVLIAVGNPAFTAVEPAVAYLRLRAQNPDIQDTFGPLPLNTHVSLGALWCGDECWDADRAVRGEENAINPFRRARR